MSQVGNRTVTNDILRQLINLTMAASTLLEYYNLNDLIIIAELLDTIENTLDEDEETSLEFTDVCYRWYILWYNINGYLYSYTLHYSLVYYMQNIMKKLMR